MLAQYLIAHFSEKKFPVRVTIEREVKMRSLAQNAKWHAMIGDIAQSIGNDVKTTKSDVKHMLCPEIAITGTSAMRPKDTHELTPPEFKDLIEATYALGVELNVEWRE